MRPFRKETPNKIWQWNIETFNYRSALQLSVRTSKEIAELLIEVMNDNPAGVVEEITDVAIMHWAIAAWANADPRPFIEEDINSCDDIYDLAACLNMHFSKYIRRCCPNSKSNDAARYLKLSLMCLERIIALLNLDIAELVDAKMQINRARSWNQLSDGNFQHA